VVTLAAALVTILLSAWINRVRGGGWGGQYLPGAGDWYSAALMTFLAALWGIHSPWAALAPWYFSALLFALCYLAWSTPAWGFLYVLWFWPPPINREPSWYEALLIKICLGSRTAAFGLRMTLFLLPMAVVFGWHWLLLGPTLLAAYVVGWLIGEAYIRLRRITPVEAYGIPFCEPLAGAALGTTVVLLAS